MSDSFAEKTFLFKSCGRSKSRELPKNKKNTMKNYLILILFILPFYGMAQQTEGKIIYEQKMNMHRNLQDESMKEYIPEFSISKVQLSFKGQEALFTGVAEEEEVDGDDGEGRNMQIRIQRPTNEIYSNFASGESVELRDFFGKKYLIEKSITARAWKITGESKSILGHPCQKATFYDEETKRNIDAWFAPSIPCPAGPANYGKLPGMILEVNINDGEMMLLAIETDFSALAKPIEAPQKGKKIEEAEYNKMMDERIREMGGTPGGGPTIKVIRG